MKTKKQSLSELAYLIIQLEHRQLIFELKVNDRIYYNGEDKETAVRAVLAYEN